MGINRRLEEGLAEAGLVVDVGCSTVDDSQYNSAEAQPVLGVRMSRSGSRLVVYSGPDDTR